MLDIKHIEFFFPEHLQSFKRHILREYLHYKILEIIFDSPFHSMLTFKGGTAIHIVHGNTRFSEDLDFDRQEMKRHDFESLVEIIQKKIHLQGCDIEVKQRTKTSYGASLKVPKVLYDNKISPLASEKLVIKIDTSPNEVPYTQSQVIINKFDVFSRINVAPLDILLAQKINALFGRKRTVGRDIYDIVFLFGLTKPNFDYLNKTIGIPSMKILKEKLTDKCKNLDLSSLAQDVESFLFQPEDTKKITYFVEYIKTL